VFAELTQGEQSDAYTEDQARSVIRLLWVAGADALHRFMPTAVLLLLERDDLRAQLLADPGLLTAFIDEALRRHPPEPVLLRATTAEVVLDGVTIPAGAVVRLAIAATNLDPARFENPDMVRLDRGSTAHLSFGAGPHRCLGAAIAYATAETALGILLEQAPRFRMRQPAAALRYVGTRAVRQLEQLVISRC
jgi:cytochrome P450